MAEPTEPLETDSFSAEESQKMYEALAAELARVKEELANMLEDTRLKDSVTKNWVDAIRSLVAVIDGDGGRAQKDETVAQSCERAGKVVADLLTMTNVGPFRLALNDPTATVEQICQALRERREVGEALEWFHSKLLSAFVGDRIERAMHWSDGTAPSIITALIRAHEENK